MSSESKKKFYTKLDKIENMDKIDKNEIGWNGQYWKYGQNWMKLDKIENVDKIKWQTKLNKIENVEEMDKGQNWITWTKVDKIERNGPNWTR